MPNEITVENWSLCPSKVDPYLPPEFVGTELQGLVFGHPSFQDGNQIRTSPIVGCNSEEGELITRSGTRYKLGQINPNYEKDFPNAREKLFASYRKSHG